MSVPQFHSYRCRDRLVNVVSVYLEGDLSIQKRTVFLDKLANNINYLSISLDICIFFSVRFLFELIAANRILQ